MSESTITRRALLAGSAAAASVLAARPVRAQSASAVSIGFLGTSSDVPLLVADKLGYFKDVGVAAKFTIFDGATRMVAPLGTEQLDVGGGSPSVGLYNAISSNIDLRMVADKASVPPGYGFGPLMVRKDLVTSGKYKSPRDLKGMKVAESTQGSMLAPALARLLATVGLRYNDVEHVYLAFPAQVAAFSNGAIDASLMAEPLATLAERQGVAVRVLSNDKWYPYQQQSVLMYGASFLRKRRDVASAFMVAYVRGLRFFNDALIGGHIRGRTAPTVLDILVEATRIKDKTIYQQMVSNAVDPNGRMNIVSLADDLEFFKEQGLVTDQTMTVARAVDTSFVDAAVRKLPPYKPHRT
ncbi:MAG TPA: ABC transporter substrate-binding protein [Candidatus Lustribacter sp.]